MNPFPPTSRYAAIPTATRTAADGRILVHLRRRFVPAPESLTVVREHLVQAGERLDHVAALHLGDPEQSWQVADANRAFDPAALVRTPGARLRIALPVPAVPTS